MADKSIQEELLSILNFSMKDGELTEGLSSISDLRGANVTVQQAIAIAQVRKALDGDTKAFQAIMSAIDKMPASKRQGLKVTAFDEITKQYKQGASRKSAS